MIVLLPGFSAKNKIWAEQLQNDLQEMGLKIQVQNWRHWDDNSESFKIEAETEAFLGAVNDEEVIVLAKSIGTRLIIELLRKHPDKFNANQVILMGIPEKHEHYIEVLKSKSNLFQIIQNYQDPYLSYADLVEWLKSNNIDIDVIKGDRNDHDYPYPELLYELCKK